MAQHTNEFTAKALTAIGDFLATKGFSKKGKGIYIRRSAAEAREDLITLKIKNGSGPKEHFDYLSLKAGIYYPEVRKLEKNIVNDSLISYPLAGGPMSLYTTASHLESYPVSDEESLKIALEKLLGQLEEGGLVFFDTFPDLQSIVEGINNKHRWLRNYFLSAGTREKISIAAMVFKASGKDAAITWLQHNVETPGEQQALISQFEKL